MAETHKKSSKNVIDYAALAPYGLRLHKPWSSAKSNRSIRHGWLVRLGCADGLCAYGDCAPLPEMGTETPEAAESQLRSGLKSIIGLDPFAALAKLDGLHHMPAARCSLETALVDLLSQHADLPVARWLNRMTRGRVAVNTAVGVVDDTLESRARKAFDKGFTLLKIKLGLRPLPDELQDLQAFARTLPEGVMLRLDANGAWDERDARQALNALRRLPVEALEEPLASPRPEVLRRLQALVPWSLALDESLRAWPLEDLLENPPVRRLVLKPMILGGLQPALQLARRAQPAGLECVITTTVDSAAGVWAALHLAAALDSDLAHGLDTAAWLAEDTGLAPLVQNASMMISETPGMGFTPFPDKLVFQAP